MMRLPIILMMLLALMAPLWNAAPASADTSYPLTCRIGTMNTVNLFSGNIYVTFNTSSGAAAAGLQPGQCAYSDRAVKASEPAAICFPGAVTGISLNATRVNTVYFSGPGTAVLTAAVSGPTTLMNFSVHQTTAPAGGPCLQVDHFGV